MLLVMETTGLFNQTNTDAKFSLLCLITKDRIELFLPGLWNELFKTTPKVTSNDTQPHDTTINNEQKVENNTHEAVQKQEQQIIENRNDSQHQPTTVENEHVNINNKLFFFAFTND